MNAAALVKLVADAAEIKLFNVREEAECLHSQADWDVSAEADPTAAAAIGVAAGVLADGVHTVEITNAICLAALSAIDDTACSTGMCSF
jgi:hypothetical protein